MKQGKPVITFVILVLAAALAIYLGFYAFDALNEPFTTTLAYQYTARDSAEASGLLDRIKALGVQVFVDGCTMEYPTAVWGTKSIMTNSGKFGTYCFNKVGIHPVFGNLRDCVETAVSGNVVRGGQLWNKSL